jgi:hypothetical protein
VSDLPGTLRGCVSPEVPARAAANRGVRETTPVTVLLTRWLIDRAVSADLSQAFQVLEDGFRAAAREAHHGRTKV